MPFYGNKRPPRVQKTPGEIEGLLLQKKNGEHKKLLKFKKSPVYRYFNLFNILCFFIYCELIMCFLGPCHYQTHYSKAVAAEHDIKRIQNGKAMLSALKITGFNERKYHFAINEFVDVPSKYSRFNIGKDFLLQKELKVSINTSGSTFWIYNAKAIFFLSVFVAMFSCIIFAYNLNENLYPLTAITVMNTVTILAVTVLY